MKERFERFIEKIIEVGDWEYADGTSMTEDARLFLKDYRQLKTAWETIVVMSKEGAVVVEPKKK